MEAIIEALKKSEVIDFDKLLGMEKSEIIKLAQKLALFGFEKNEFVNNFIESVSIYFNIDSKLWLSNSRKHEYVVCRSCLSALCYEFTDMTLTQIAFKCHYNNHATVIHNIAKTTNKYDVMPSYNSIVNTYFKHLETKRNRMIYEGLNY